MYRAEESVLFTRLSLKDMLSLWLKTDTINVIHLFYYKYFKLMYINS